MRKIITVLKKIVPYPLYELIWRIWHGHFSYYFWIFPIKKNKICITSYYGKGYGDNSKYIVDYLLRKSSDQFEIVWLVDTKNPIDYSLFPDNVRVVEYGTWSSLYELATSKVWIDDCRKFIYPPKRKNQYYIQTWHGGIPLKKIEKDAADKLGSFYVNMSKRDSLNIDLLLSNSAFNTLIFEKSFWYDGEILEKGLPRNEYLTKVNSKKLRKKISHYIGHEVDRVCLYAPTFRQNHDLSVYDLDYFELSKRLEKRTGKQWTILVRLHPNMSKYSNKLTLPNNTYDVTDYPDMQELLGASNLLITDYSSSMFDQLFLDSICILYAPDINNYQDERGFYLGMEELPFPIAEDNKQLFRIIEMLNREAYIEEENKFKEQLGVYDQNVLEFLHEYLVNICELD